MSDRLKTYEEWQRLGYHVIRGEHSEHKNKWGEYLFRPDQVEEAYEEDIAEEELNYWLDYDDLTL